MKLKSPLLIVILALIQSGCGLERTRDWNKIATFPEIKTTVFELESGMADTCLLQNIVAYANKIKQFVLDRCNPPWGVTETYDLTVLIADNWPYLGAYDGRGNIHILFNFQQLRIFGHEYARAVVQATSCDEWAKDDLTWKDKGLLGETWNFAENKGLELCGG